MSYMVVVHYILGQTHTSFTIPQRYTILDVIMKIPRDSLLYYPVMIIVCHHMSDPNLVHKWNNYFALSLTASLSTNDALLLTK